MFEDIRGLAPERAARLASLVEQCQPLLEQDSGMEAVQRVLRDRGTGVIDSVAVTRELLGAGPGSLAEAKTIVLSSAARTAELRVHQQLMEEIEQAKDVSDAILHLAQSNSAATRIVAIDGAGGSGKTTLAAAVAGQLDDCVIVHGDDFYLPMPDHERQQLDAEQGYHRYFDWQRLRAQVLKPLRAHQTARYQTYDWATGQLGDWQQVTAGGVVIVEGVYSARPELTDSYDLTVYVDTPREICLQRLQARAENSAEWILRWRAAEDYYLHTTRPENRSTIVVKGC
jgi:uridine kinase